MKKKYTNILYSVEAIQWDGNNLYKIKCFDSSTRYSIRGKDKDYIVDHNGIGCGKGSWLVKKSFYFEDIRDSWYNKKTGKQRRIDEDYYFWLSNDEFNNKYQDSKEMPDKNQQQKQ